jgi:hypothetical protein
MPKYFASWFLARIGPHDGSSSAPSQGNPGETLRLETSRVEIWPSAPEMLAVDDQAGVTVLLHGDVYSPLSSPRGLLKAYLSEGESLFASLNGAFAVMIIDQRNDRAYVATDRFNSRKVFLSDEDGVRWLSSTLLRHPTSSHELDPAGVGSLLTSGVVHGDLTPFVGIKKLQPASVYRFSGDDETVRRYWTFNGEEEQTRQEPAELQKQLIDLMRSSVERRVREPGDIYVSLSGGYDSRAVAGLLVEAVDDRRRIRSMTYHHGPQVGDTDAGAAAAVASYLGISHEVLEGHRGDIVETILANAEASQGLANFCMEVDFWKTVGPLLAASPDNALFVAEIPGMGPVPKGGTPQSVLATVSLFPISTIEEFIGYLEPTAGDAISAGVERLLRLPLEAGRISP